MYNTEILYPYIITKEEIVCTWEWPIIEEYISLSKRGRGLDRARQGTAC